jgi:phosphoribosyl 1,2-cyclic phosphodiesterase
MLRLKFWGVRGSTPTPQIDNLAYGGNTACLEVRVTEREVFVFDGGTGVRNLGLSLMKEFAGARQCIRFFLTHFHWDHIQGIPFFVPIYGADNDITFFSSVSQLSLHETLEGQMQRPYFPVNFDSVAAKRSFVEVQEGERLSSGGLTVHPFPLNHPQGCVGYRIEANGRVVVYASDLEHGHAELDRVVRDYAQGADVLIYDAQYTPEEYESHRGWGHSTWLEATKVAKDARARQLILTHHDPSHSDTAIYEIVRGARECFENTIAAREGLEIVL